MTYLKSRRDPAKGARVCPQPSFLLCRAVLWRGMGGAAGMAGCYLYSYLIIWELSQASGVANGGVIGVGTGGGPMGCDSVAATSVGDLGENYRIVWCLFA